MINAFLHILICIDDIQRKIELALKRAVCTEIFTLSENCFGIVLPRSAKIFLISGKLGADEIFYTVKTLCVIKMPRN